MVNQLQQIWKGSSWLKRYMHSSFELNMRLAGLAARLDKSAKTWTPTRIKSCMAWMRSHSTKLDHDAVYYRGTSKASVMIEADPESLVTPKRNRCILSLTSSKAIAKEFAWPKGKGYMHTLKLAKGCRVVGMQYEDVAKVAREKEMLLLPGHQLDLVSRNGRSMTWEVHKR